MNWMCMPIAEEFKDVNRGNRLGTTAFFASDYEGDTLYRETTRSEHRVLERAAIISGEFRPRLFESGGDWCAAFPVLGPWEEIHRAPVQDPESKSFDEIADYADQMVLRRWAEKRGVSDYDAEVELAAMRWAEFKGCSLDEARQDVRNGNTWDEGIAGRYVNKTSES